MTVPTDSIFVHSKFGEDLMPEWKWDKVKGDNAGLDIRTPHDIWLPPGCETVVDTGLVIDMARYHTKIFMLALPRSSTGCRLKVRLQNTAGVIDPSYNGEGDTLKMALRRDQRAMEVIGSFRIDDEEYAEATDEGFNAQTALAERVARENLKGYDFDRVVTRPDFVEDRVYVRCMYIPEPQEDLIYRKGERFCQLLFLPYENPEVRRVAKEYTQRNSDRGGFGSTGVK